YPTAAYLLSSLAPPGTPPTPIPTLSLHDALPISLRQPRRHVRQGLLAGELGADALDLRVPVEDVDVARVACIRRTGDRVHERSRSEEHTSELSHGSISYAVFCLKKKTHAIVTQEK